MDGYEYYKEKAVTAHKIDFDDYPILMLQSIKEDENYEPPFSHIIIDEAQDLSKAQILALSGLVSNETRSITIIADAAQKIYKKGFTWSEVGIEVRGGRTLSLKKNYRNTEAILKASISLLDHEPDKSEFTEAEAGRKGGERPTLGYFKNWNEQLNYLLKKLKEIDFENTVTVILHREWRGMRRVSQALSEHNIGNEIINGNSILNFDNNLIKICTLSSVKGLEFDNVFIIDLNEGIIPYPDGFDKEEDEFHISTERRLLYTSMTRARDVLYLLSSRNPSRYLSEIDEELVDVERDNK